ncbi:hypothetical protein B0H16DRAFT_1752171 [Mycena metata]|nr:hypothetical protein B0H16DRAFT_1752171 [Mycena metata]
MAPTRVCKKCRHEKDISSHNWKAKFGTNGFGITANCRRCLDQAANTMRQNRGAPEKENLEDENDASDFIGVDALAVDAYLEALSEAGDINVFSALVDISSLLEDQDEIEDIEEREIAHKLARLVWEAIGYRFL